MTHDTTATNSAPDIAHDDLFDLNSALTARPVTPLAASATHDAKAARRAWFIPAIALSAVVGSLTGIAAFSLYQRRQATPTQAQEVALPRAPVVASMPAAEPSSTSSVETAASSEIENTERAEPRTATIAPVSDDGASGDEAKRETRSPDAATNARSSKERNTDEDGGKLSGERSGARRASAAAATTEKSAAAETNAVERRAAGERVEKQPARGSENRDERREARSTGRDEQQRASVPAAQRERRATTSHAENSEQANEATRTAAPGYVDAVRRAIGDRPARRRNRNRNGDRLREIFEGREP